MKKILIISIILIVLIYLNRSYAHIFHTIEQLHPEPPVIQSEYTFKTNSQKPLFFEAVGDSLTAGTGVSDFTKSYPYLLAQLLSQKDSSIFLKVKATPGARSEYILNNTIRQVILDQPDIVTILIGTNDVFGNVSQKDFVNNYELILQKIKKETKAKIYLISIPYIGDKNLILPPYNYYFNWKIKEFNTSIKELSDKYSADYIDIYTPLLEYSKNTNYYSEDSFHPSQEGYKIWSALIYDAFNQ